MKREFVSVAAKALSDQETNEVVVSLHGPRGGLRACEALTVENAEILALALLDRVAKIRDAKE